MLTCSSRERSALLRAVDRFVPWRDGAELDELFRARLTGGISVASAAVAAFFVVYCRFVPALRPAWLLCSLGVVLFVANLVVLRRRERLAMASWALSLELTALTAVAAWMAHGFRDISSSLQLAFPLLAIFLIGARRGLWLVAASLANTLALWQLEVRGFYAPPLDAAREEPVMVIASGLAMIFFVLTIGMLYEHTQAARQRLLDGAIDRLRAANAEITAMQQQVIAAEKLSSLGMLAAGIAHEINNPMAFVTSNVSCLAKELETLRTDDELFEEYSKEVLPATLDGIRRVNAIVGDLRRFARGDPEAFSKYDLNQEIGAAVRMAQPELRKRNCRIDVELAPLPPVVGRPRQVMQVVMNLIVNAAQASASGATVRIDSWSAGDEVAIRIRDSGVGMSEETRAKLFQPFFTTKPTGQGTGLGLAVAHGIVTSHRGRIDVESTPGVGSAFTVWLPTVPQPTIGQAPAAATGAMV